LKRKVFTILMQFVDLIAISPISKNFDDLMLAISTLYVVIGSKDLMGAFNYEFNMLFDNFLHSFPISD